MELKELINQLLQGQLQQDYSNIFKTKLDNAQSFDASAGLTIDPIAGGGSINAIQNTVSKGVTQGANNVIAGDAENGLLGMLGGEKGGGFKGNLGPISMAAGVAGDMLGAFAPKLTSNAAGTASGSFDFGADLTARQASKKEGRDNAVNTAIAPLESIPVIGGFAKLGKGLYNMGSSIFQPKASMGELGAEANQAYLKENAGAKSNLYADAFTNDYLAACGGYMKAHAMGGPTTIEVGGTHEENSQNGITISPGNKAEEGEIVVDLPKGQFVFTNRF